MHKFGANCLVTIMANLVLLGVFLDWDGIIWMYLIFYCKNMDVSDILLQKYEDLCLYSVDILCPK